MMPELGKYAGVVLSSYAVTMLLLLIVLLLFWCWQERVALAAFPGITLVLLRL